mgnify:FL=1|jgi:hypothetical protein
MSSLNDTIDSFNAHTKRIQDYLTLETTQILFQDHELGTLNDQRQKEYDSLQDIIRVNKEQKYILLEQVKLVKKGKLEALEALKHIVPETVTYYNMDSWVDN